MRFCIALVLLLGSIAHADNKEYYVKSGNGFTKVEKVDAVLALLNKKGDVLGCQEMRVTKKLTLKARTNNDD